MVNLQSSAAQASPEQREKLTALKADPELKLVFDDIETNGPGESLSFTHSLFPLRSLHKCSISSEILR